VLKRTAPSPPKPCQIAEAATAMDASAGRRHMREPRACHDARKLARAL